MKRQRERKSIQKRNRLLLFACFILLTLTTNLSAQEVTAEAGFDKASITIGEKVKYTITIEMPKDTDIELPIIDQTLTSIGLVVRDFGEEKPVKITKNRVKKRYWYLLDAYVTGSYNVPTVTINYTLPDGTKGNVATKDVFLEVKGVIKEGEKAEDIRDIKGPVEIKYSYKKIILWGIIVLCLILLLGIGIPVYIKNRHLIIPPPPPIPPHIIALKELEKIKGIEDVKEYYISVSSIVRHYIEDRFHLHAPERTTEEFLSELSTADTLKESHKVLLRDFLRHCDLVKFARYGPTREEIEGVYKTAKRFVEETSPQERQE